MKARTALLELFKKSSEGRAFFRSCCETSRLRLRSQAWQFCDALKDRGHKLRAEEVEDALAHLARSYAGLSAEEKVTVDLSGQDEWDERMHEAGLANDPVAFRVALDGWTRAGLEAMEQIRIKGGAA